ncbi:eukaryotic translation initiation factor 2-alpha kinase isoform X2 [Eurytemora carolleeae]|uniref:eukaryotic translation initiation factor 2-alpha kinase isoform X2 n=1 Tax=Eurytemora carolleeae TaxID=1294199 RepID=UPI000C780458|nr:eukaryotic translation initiation factor 2-alpha kinase isoform X2 [Eurytemora carolleeae]|eukprot:XP_023320471.1 eukaryotic translation initiation factor 2-alpha kinase-like isoform X2 [Eurytemora affinis]
MRVYIYLAGLGVCLLLAGRLTYCGAMEQEYSYTEEDTNPEVTIRPPSTLAPPVDDPILPLCPPKPVFKENSRKNLLLVSTLDGQISALDLNKEGEMFWSVSTFPGSMLSSTISNMDLDNRGHFVKLIPSLTGRLYKFNGDVVEPIPMDVDSLLGSSLKMQENMVVTGGKESRTYGILLDTGEILYECSMNECTNFQQTSKEILVVQRNTQTVRAHTPRTGDQKWNFSVSLHDVSYHPSDDPCTEEDDDGVDLLDIQDDFSLKTVVPDGMICATRSEDQNLIKWKRKFQAPIVDVWRLKNGELSKVNLFSKNHIPKRNVLLDDDDDVDDDENPSLYIGKHNNQLYIQESVQLRRDADSALHEYSLNPAGSELAYPRVTWKPYLVSPSRTPVFNLGTPNPDLGLITFEQTIRRGDSKNTALAITANNAEYPYDSGLYLYPDTTSLNPDDTITNMTTILGGQEVEEEEAEPQNTIEYISRGLSYYWMEVIFISLVTAVMMNVLITRPIIHQMRDNFQTLQTEKAKEVVREVFVEVPVPSFSGFPSTPSVGTNSSSGPDFSTIDRQNSEFSSRYLSDFEPVQCLGRGGFGVVFESKNKYDDIHYAVKRITLPSSEESKKKVMREVKLHAKLDHKHIVRYFSTWLESPPPGWQETADSWFQDQDVGTGPTPFDPTATDYSMSIVEGVKKNDNPLKPFSMSSTRSRQENSSGKYRCNALDRTGEQSFSITFEDSSSELWDKNVSRNSDSRSDSSDDSDCDSIGSPQLAEDTTGGIVFETDPLEIKGSVEAIAVDMDNTSSGPFKKFKQSKSGSSESLSCYDALDWDINQNSGSSKETRSRAKSYLYIVMQLCRKDTLRDWLRNNRSESEILSVFSQICVGVHYVHRQGLIHRDLKPSNIYFAPDGAIKIGDFGLVTGTVLDTGGYGDSTRNEGCEDDQLTDQVGTQMYMSPEQLQQKPYNHKVDIFSLGLIFLELLVPFSTQMERQYSLSQVKKGNFPEQILGSPEYTQLLGMMLHLKSENRPEAEEILNLPWIQGHADTSPRNRLSTSGSESSIIPPFSQTCS